MLSDDKSRKDYDKFFFNKFSKNSKSSKRSKIVLLRDGFNFIVDLEKKTGAVSGILGFGIGRKYKTLGTVGSVLVHKILTRRNNKSNKGNFKNSYGSRY